MALVFLWRRNLWVAVAAGLLLAVNPLHLWYSQEARGYALMLLLGLACMVSFELARSMRRQGWWIGYVLCAIGATAVHKTGLVFPLACAVLDLFAFIRRTLPVKRLIPHLTLVAVAGLLVIEASQPPAPE